MNKKLAIITTHPIQYYAPVFALIHKRAKIGLKVFYTIGNAAPGHDPGFDRDVTWDIPLLEGYPYEWVVNTSVQPGSHHFKGIINPGLIEQINSFAPDALLVVGWAYKSHLKALRHFKGKIPVWFRGDSTLLDEKRGIRTLFKTLFLKWVYWHVDRAFYNGTNNKAYFKKYGLKDHQLVFAPHAVDNERFGALRKREAMLLKKELGMSSTDLLVLFAGKFSEKKDPELLLNAFISLNDPSLHLLFVGNGVLEDSLKEKAALYPKIHYMDFQNQSYMPVVYQASDLFCLPSKGPGETWGLVVNEAMACSKAVLVSDKCGCAVDLVQESKNGAIFRNCLQNDLLSNLENLTRTKAFLTEMGEASKNIIAPYNFLSVAEAIESIFAHETE